MCSRGSEQPVGDQGYPIDILVEDNVQLVDCVEHGVFQCTSYAQSPYWDNHRRWDKELEV